MNRTYRLVWNKALRVLQVASEHASAPGGAATGASGAPPRANLLWLALLASGGFAAASPVLAQTCVPNASAGCSAPGGGVPAFATGDGAGGGGAGNGMGGAALHYDVTLAPANQAAGSQSLNGAGGAGASGVQTRTGVTVLGGAGGAPGDFFAGTLGQGVSGGNGASHGDSPSGGGGGGAGEYAAYPGLSLASGAILLGGAGGNGGSVLAGNGFGAGGGGGGGAGIMSVASNFGLVLQTTGVSSTGGAGGRGGDNTQPGVAFGGGGGGGGDGALLFGAATSVFNAGTITGGAGGAGGSATSPIGSGGAGASGAGIRALNTGLTLTNTGTVRGGALTGNGAAGAGVITQGGATINNSGTLAGGASGAGYASAVVFNGTGSTLNLMAGSVIHGLVELNANAAATLANSTTATLDGVKLNGGTASVRLDTGTSGNSLSLSGQLSGTGNASSSGAGNLVLRDVNLVGALALDHIGGTVIGGNVTTTGAQSYTGTLALNATRVFTSGAAIDFVGGFSGMGNLSVTAGGNITANGGVILNGSGTFLATGKDISLSNAGNQLFGQMNATGRNITFAAASALLISGIDSTGNTLLASPNTLLYGNVQTQGTLTFNGGSVIQGAGTVAANTLAGALSGDLLLSSAGNVINTLGTLSARDVALGGVTPLTISGDVNVRSINLSPFAPTTLTGTLQSTGSVVLPTGGELRVGTGATAGQLNGNIDNGGTLIFNRSDASAYAYALSGSGAVRKQGTGSLLFDGSAAVFTGATTVEAGRLVVGSSAGSGATLGGAGVTVNTGATLGGHGTVDTNVVVQSGARLAPGNSIGTLTVTGDLQLQPGAILDVELGAPDPSTPFAAAGQGDSVVVGGNLSINNAVLNISDGGGFGAGLYRLFTWGNGLTLASGGFASIPQGNILQILGASRQINLIVPGNTPLQFWNANGQATANSAGGGSGVWSNTAPVWTDAQGTLTAGMSPNPGNAIFAGDAGTVTVSSSSGAVSAQSLQFASDGYVLSGDALTLVADAQGTAPIIRVGDGSALGAGYTTTINSVLTGSAGLQKTDLGMLVLTAANTWTGTTRLAGGVLSVASESALGDASAALVLDGGMLQVTGTALDRLQRNVALGAAGGGFDIADADHTFVLDHALTGSGALLKRGDGTLVLQGTQLYTGGTVVDAGTLQGDTESLQGSVVNNAALVVEQDSNGTLAADVSGTGALTKRGTGTVQLAGNNTYTGGTFIEAGTLQGSASALRGPIQNDGTLVLDRNEDSVLADAFTGSGRLLKTGTGTLVVQQAQGYTGSTQVEQGTLVVGDASTANATLGGSVSIGQGARLQGVGRVGSLDLQGTLAPGNGIGTLTVTGDLQLQPGAILDVELGAPDPSTPFAAAGQGDSVVVGGNLSINNAVLNISDGGGFGAGLYRLFTWGNTLTLTNGGFASIPQGNVLQILGASRQINLIVPGNTPLQFWNANGQASANSAGGGSGVWSNTAPVWTDAQGTLTAGMSPNPGNAVFAGDAGTVTVSNSSGAVSTQSLQFASDGYVLSGDALTLVADPQGAAPIIRVGDGSALGAGYTTTISSVLTGSAGLQKTDLGTLVLTAANSWTGTTRIAGGVLSVASESALGDASAALLLDGGVLQVTGTALDRLQRNVALGAAGGGFDIADADHTFVLDHALTGSGALLKRGDGTLLLQGTQLYTGGTFIEAGTLQGSASALRGPIQNDGTLVLDRNEDSVLAEAFTGSGRLLKTGTGTLVVQQAQGYTGSTQVEQGTLVVGDASTANATLGGNVSIGQGARLQGGGRVGSLDLQGTLAPGNSIGTLHVSGNAVLQASARYEVEVDADGRHDQLAVDGTTTILGGSVVSLADGAAWNPLTRYTLITSQGGVTGRFNTVSNNLAFLTPTLEYAPTSVTLALARNQVAFPAVGTTYNQRSTATALESLGSGALYDRVVVMDEGSARQAFDAYSGEVHASTQVTLLDDAARVRRSLANRLVGADAGGASEGGPASGWATAWGHQGRNDADGNAARGRQQGTGWMAGADLGFENEAVLGVAVGQARSTLEVEARSADARTNSKYAGLYGGVGLGAWALRGGVTGGRTDSRVQRRAGDQQLHSSDDARLWQGFVDVAHGSTVGRLHLEPYLNYAHVRLEQDGFQEWGGDAALVGDAQTRTLDIGTAGLRTQWHLDSRFSTAVVLNLGYQRAWGDTTSALSQQFAAGGAAFLVNGLPVEETAGVAELGFTTQLTPRVEFRADYQGRFGSSVRDQGAQLTVRAQF